jgi:hypothetical protein
MIASGGEAEVVYLNGRQRRVGLLTASPDFCFVGCGVGSCGRELAELGLGDSSLGRGPNWLASGAQREGESGRGEEECP